MRRGSIGKQNNLQHGHSTGGKESPTYKSWSAMKARCCRPTASNYAWYGARGIRVCERWMAFPNFLDDMGEAPAGHTIDRINTNGNYEPGNCRWVLPVEQNRNRRTNRMLTHNGETRCIAEWAEVTCLRARSIWQRLNRGWSVERALARKEDDASR